MVVQKCAKMWMRSSQVWMRSSQVVRASGCQCKSRNSLGSIPASSDTVESDEAVLNIVHKNKKNPPLKCVQSIESNIEKTAQNDRQHTAFLVH